MNCLGCMPKCANCSLLGWVLVLVRRWLVLLLVGRGNAPGRCRPEQRNQRQHSNIAMSVDVITKQTKEILKNTLESTHLTSRES